MLHYLIGPPGQPPTAEVLVVVVVVVVGIGFLFGTGITVRFCGTTEQVFKHDIPRRCQYQIVLNCFNDLGRRRIKTRLDAAVLRTKTQEHGN
jgi:hypothetical protein